MDIRAFEITAIPNCNCTDDGLNVVFQLQSASGQRENFAVPVGLVPEMLAKLKASAEASARHDREDVDKPGQHRIVRGLIPKRYDVGVAERADAVILTIHPSDTLPLEIAFARSDATKLSQLLAQCVGGLESRKR